MSRDRIIQLQECAEDLGFSTIAEALDAGYHEVQDLVAGTFTLEKIEDEQELAHQAWLKEKQEVLDGLRDVINDDELLSWSGMVRFVERAMKFIEEAHD